VPHSNAFLPALRLRSGRTAVRYFLLYLWVGFALCERKTDTQRRQRTALPKAKNAYIKHMGQWQIGIDLPLPHSLKYMPSF
jgi:hypothetical protein